MITWPDGAVVVAALEADPAERRVAGGDPDPELRARDRAAAIRRQGRRTRRASRLARRTARSAWSGCRTGSLKNVMNPSPAKCSSVPSCSR